MIGKDTVVVDGLSRNSFLCFGRAYIGSVVKICIHY